MRNSFSASLYRSLPRYSIPSKYSLIWMRGFFAEADAWANSIATHLNQSLPARYYALPLVQLGGAIEIDVATVEEPGGVGANGGVPWPAPESE